MRRAAHKLIAASSILPILALTGCEVLLRQPAPTDRALPDIEGFKDIRYYPVNPAMPPPGVAAADRDAPADPYQKEGDALVYDHLAVSGGGAEGAFGAGLLQGWARSGQRPKFKIATGVSTGALAAPVAFLDPGYDGALKEAYTTVDARRLYLAHSPVHPLWRTSRTKSRSAR
jgi:hypothetical protein